MGWDAEVVARVDRRRRARPTDRHTTADRLRPGGLRQFFLHTDRRHPVLTLERPGEEPVPLHMAIVANTAPWTYLGDRPLLPSPEASFDTGLDLYALTRLRTIGTLGEVRRLLRSRPSPGARARGRWSTGSTTSRSSPCGPADRSRPRSTARRSATWSR